MGFEGIIGKTKRMKEVLVQLDKLAQTELPVLILGETGTGKELVARALHYNGPRKHKAFVSENFAAISASLLESELFGYEPGAFTGAAAKRKQGLFELASGGTLFLDEVGEMSVEMQRKLLRVLQEGEIRRVGGKDKIQVDVRIISATNQDLRGMIEKGSFRQDLYYRLKGVTLTLPPLRERRIDIPDLVDHFLNQFAEETGEPKKEIDPRARELLEQYSWPGNIRELENEVNRMQVMGHDPITPDVLSTEIRGSLAEWVSRLLVGIETPAEKIAELWKTHENRKNEMEDAELAVLLFRALGGATGGRTEIAARKKLICGRLRMDPARLSTALKPGSGAPSGMNAQASQTARHWYLSQRKLQVILPPQDAPYTIAAARQLEQDSQTARLEITGEWPWERLKSRGCLVCGDLELYDGCYFVEGSPEPRMIWLAEAKGGLLLLGGSVDSVAPGVPATGYGSVGSLIKNQVERMLKKRTPDALPFEALRSQIDALGVEPHRGHFFAEIYAVQKNDRIVIGLPFYIKPPAGEGHS